MYQGFNSNFYCLGFGIFVDGSDAMRIINLGWSEGFFDSWIRSSTYNKPMIISNRGLISLKVCTYFCIVLLQGIRASVPESLKILHTFVRFGGLNLRQQRGTRYKEIGWCWIWSMILLVWEKVVYIGSV